MIGAALLTCAAMAAAPDVTGFPREEAPWAVVVVAAEGEGLTGLDRVVVAALMESPSSWPAGHPVQRVLHRGGTVRARASADGIVVRLAGHTDDARLLWSAADELFRMPRPTPLTLARAQGRILRARAEGLAAPIAMAPSALLVGARGQQGFQAQDLTAAIWQQWFDERSPVASLIVDDIALHRRGADEVWTAYAAWSATAARAVFAEGHLPDDWRSPPPARDVGSALMPGTNKALLALPAATAARELVASHPLPPGEVGEIEAALLVGALTRTEAPVIAARVVRSRDAALLVLATPLGERAPEAALEAMRAHLLSTQERLADRRARTELRRQAAATLARRHRVIGDRAQAAAEAWLAGTYAAEATLFAAETAPLRALLFPEALRAVVVEPLPTR